MGLRAGELAAEERAALQVQHRGGGERQQCERGGRAPALQSRERPHQLLARRAQVAHRAHALRPVWQDEARHQRGGDEAGDGVQAELRQPGKAEGSSAANPQMEVSTPSRMVGHTVRRKSPPLWMKR